MKIFLVAPLCSELLSPQKKLLIYHKIWQWKVLLFLKLFCCCCCWFFFLLSLSHRWDYLRITSGNSNVIGTYCGNHTGKSVRVLGTIAELTFHTDWSVQDRGFELSFSFFPISPGEFSTRLSSSFSPFMYHCYSSQSWVTGFVSRAHSQEGVFTVHLTHRFDVAVRLISDRSQMTSICGENKKNGTRAVKPVVSHWCFYLILTSSAI